MQRLLEIRCMYDFKLLQSAEDVIDIFVTKQNNQSLHQKNGTDFLPFFTAAMRNWCQTMHPPDPWSVNNWLFIRNNGCHELVRLPAYRLRPDEALPCRPPPASPATSPPEAINLDFLPVSDVGLVGHSHPACCQVIRPFLGPEPPRRGPSSQFLNSTGRWTQKLFHFHEVLFSCRCYSWVLALF